MTALTQPGNYQIEVLEIALQDSEKSSAVFVAILGRVSTIWQDGQWLSCENWPETTVSGRTCIQKGDGSVSEVGVNQLKAAFGWNPADGIEWVESNGVGCLINANCKVETFNDRNGQPQSKVAITWIDHCTAAPLGGLKKMADSARSSLSAGLNANLRALGTPTRRNVPPAAPPAATAPAGVSRPAAARPPAAAPPPQPAGQPDATDNAANNIPF